MSWQKYNAVKQLVSKYWELKEPQDYDEFIYRLAEILEV